MPFSCSQPSHSRLTRYVLRPLSVGYARLFFGLLLVAEIPLNRTRTARLPSQSLLFVLCHLLAQRTFSLHGKLSGYISTARLKPLQALHLPPIHVVVFDGPCKEILS